MRPETNRQALGPGRGTGRPGELGGSPQLVAAGEILVSSVLRVLVESSGEFEFGDDREMELKGLTGTHKVFGVDV